MGTRSQDFYGVSWTMVLQSLQLQVKLCKDLAREFKRVSRQWSVRVRAASNDVSLIYKEFIKLIRKRLGGNI